MSLPNRSTLLPTRHITVDSSTPARTESIQLRTLRNDCSDVTSNIRTTPSALRKYCFVMERNLQRHEECVRALKRRKQSFSQKCAKGHKKGVSKKLQHWMCASENSSRTRKVPERVCDTKTASRHWKSANLWEHWECVNEHENDGSKTSRSTENAPMHYKGGNAPKTRHFTENASTHRKCANLPKMRQCTKKAPMNWKCVNSRKVHQCTRKASMHLKCTKNAPMLQKRANRRVVASMHQKCARPQNLRQSNVNASIHQTCVNTPNLRQCTKNAPMHRKCANAPKTRQYTKNASVTSPVRQCPTTAWQSLYSAESSSFSQWSRLQLWHWKAVWNGCDRNWKCVNGKGWRNSRSGWGYRELRQQDLPMQKARLSDSRITHKNDFEDAVGLCQLLFDLFVSYLLISLINGIEFFCQRRHFRNSGFGLNRPIKWLFDVINWDFFHWFLVLFDVFQFFSVKLISDKVITHLISYHLLQNLGQRVLEICFILLDCSHFLFKTCFFQILIFVENWGLEEEFGFGFLGHQGEKLGHRKKWRKKGIWDSRPSMWKIRPPKNIPKIGIWDSRPLDWKVRPPQKWQKNRNLGF